uniref:Uncharacterized protein n=1 Tax=Ditylum brightwellii TaxID=49249 RepID=A0A6U3Q6U1_9STRA|mmetsp:Transcript_18753/g.27994  ORF Transcript_18753/g.27994 Transcript_18753/m.27994 type:complete len:155 (+) Transcript_18753:800-1264(+)
MPCNKSKGVRWQGATLQRAGETLPHLPAKLSTPAAAHNIQGRTLCTHLHAHMLMRYDYGAHVLTLSCVARASAQGAPPTRRGDKRREGNTQALCESPVWTHEVEWGVWWHRSSMCVCVCVWWHRSSSGGDNRPEAVASNEQQAKYTPNHVLLLV